MKKIPLSAYSTEEKLKIAKSAFIDIIMAIERIEDKYNVVIEWDQCIVIDTEAFRGYELE